MDTIWCNYDRCWPNILLVAISIRCLNSGIVTILPYEVYNSFEWYLSEHMLSSKHKSAAVNISKKFIN